MPQFTDALAQSIESLLHTIPERWHDFDHDDLTATEQQALFLLVVAGLVERRMSVKGEFAGQAPAIEFAIDVTGEYGIVEAIEPVAAEMWTKWGPSFELWKLSDSGGTTPFRFTRPGSDRWRLTEHGVMARADLDIQAPSAGSAAFVGSYQRAMEYITRTGHQADRPSVQGEGRLVDLKCSEPSVEAVPTPVAITNWPELAAAFRDLVVPALAEALRETVAPSPSAEDTGDDTTAVPPALTLKEATVLRTLAIFDPSELVSAARIESEMELSVRLSARTIGKAIGRLIEFGLAERPLGERSGTRLAIAGRRLAQKIAD